MSSPKYKLYTPSGEYVGSAKYAEDAARFVNSVGEGATIRLEHKYTIWNEGHEVTDAMASFDEVAAILWEREADIIAKAKARRKPALEGDAAYPGRMIAKRTP